MRLLVAALLCSIAVTGTAAAAFKPVKGNPADKLDSLPIEGYRYDLSRRCTKHPTPGALAMVAWLKQNSPGEFWGIMRCEKLGPHNYSLHADGRAIDWHLDVHTAAGRVAANRLISLLLAPDKLGNEHALARRMGVQEIIWNCTAWWSGPGGMEKYSVCYDKKGHRKHVDDTTAHRNQVHIGLNHMDARKLTSFWTHE
ncbi:MAG TPA: hypothetical protein VH817_21485 [Thermoleophilaceae bacterium]